MDVLEQADDVSGMLPSIMEEDFYSRSKGIHFLLFKLKTLAYGLEQFDSIEKAEAFLDDYVKSAHIEALVIYDRNGRVLYGSEELAEELNYDAAAVESLLNTDIYQELEDQSYYDNPEHREQDNIYSCGVDDKWLVAIKDAKLDAQQYIEHYFDWRSVIPDIQIGQTGSVLVFDGSDGTVLADVDQDKTGRSIKDLDLNAGETGPVNSIDELTAVFANGDNAEELVIEGTTYFAARVNGQGEDVILALLPLDEVMEDVKSTTAFLLMLFLFPSLSMAYCFFHAEDKRKLQPQTDSRKKWNRSLSAKLWVFTLLTVAAMLAQGFYLEGLAVYAEAFNYTERKVENAVQNQNNNEEALVKLQEWETAECETECRLAGCILKYTENEKITRDYLSGLSESLGVLYICIFDDEGALLATDSPYERLTIERSSPFYALLEGRDILVLPPETDRISSETVQKAGMSTKNEEGSVNGVIMTVSDPSELEEISEGLRIENVFTRICMKEKTAVIVADTADLTIKYISGMEEDLSAETVAELGIDESNLRDGYNGNILIQKELWFASVRKCGNNYFLVMYPQLGLQLSNIIPVLSGTALAILFIFAMLVILCIDKDDKVFVEKEPESFNIGKSIPGIDEWTDAVKTLENHLNQKKLYFEERWPRDSKKWRDRTSEEQFSTASRVILFTSLISIFIYAVLTGERSIWYYCIQGDWTRGIHLYSITSCIISVCLLFLIGLAVHKLLYLTAKAVQAKGETICCLLDSISGYALFIAGVFICLNNIGVNATALSLTGGIAGVIFGIGCQSIVSDILAGIIMTFEGIACVGDYVVFKGKPGIILSIGVRNTRLKWYGEILVVRNDEFKDYLNLPYKEESRGITSICISSKESLERVIPILEKELPVVRERLEEYTGVQVRNLLFRGVTRIDNNGLELSFAVFCKNQYHSQMIRQLNVELKLMCERNEIKLATISSE